jgi:hypothetical protein
MKSKSKTRDTAVQLASNTRSTPANSQERSLQAAEA